MDTASQLRVDQTRLGRHVILKLSGVIDGLLRRSDLTVQTLGVVLVDLHEVVRITSPGVRAWLESLSETRASYLAYARCRPAIVAQLNAVRTFCERGEIVSLYLPYACARCSRTFEHLVDLQESYAALRAGKLPEVPCVVCEQPGAFDELPDSYFRFLGPKPPAVPLVMRGLLQHEALQVASAQRSATLSGAREQLSSTMDALDALLPRRRGGK